MRKTFFGRTGLEISEIAFGGGVTGGILIKADETTRYSALRRAVAAGINWIDTAPVYGNGASEETIGRHLAALDAAALRLHQGAARSRGHERHPGRDRAQPGAEPQAAALRSRRAVPAAQSARRRRWATGSALTPEQVLGRGGVADTFDRLKEQGLVHATGITAAGDTKACLEVIDSGRFDCAQVYYNAINPSAAWSARAGGMERRAGFLPASWRPASARTWAC